MGVTVRGFTFSFSNLENLLRNLIEQSQGLIKKETGTEQTSSVLARVHFFPEQKAIEGGIKNSKNVPVVYYINESYFLYNKSELIKETFITVLNKKLLVYSSISYCNKKNRKRDI